MNTYKEIVYMVLDELRILSDDSTFNENHIIFLASKYRSLLLKQKYSNIKVEIPLSNYQELCIGLEKVDAIDGLPCEGGYYLRSTKPIPALMTIGNPKVYPVDYYQGDMLTYVSKERMMFTGFNKYLKNIIYCSIAPNEYLYLKSQNPQFLYLEKVRIYAIFEDPEKAEELSCDATCDIMDSVFPCEDDMIPMVVQSCVKELSGSVYRPKDNANDGRDTLPQDAQASQQATQQNDQSQQQQQQRQ